ncbi:MAG: hypothetical protein HQ463_01380 [Bacteroidetes bacterium]|nr:hypothetical protein [Bacteroidota bacterium]
MFNKLIIGIFLLFAVISCKNNQRTESEINSELILIDSLDARLNYVKSFLDETSYEDLQERNDIIDNNYDFCKKSLIDKKIVEDEETNRILEEYKAIGFIYKKAIANYKNIVLELEDLYGQSKTLRQSATAKDYNKETYKTYYSQQKEDIGKLILFSNDVLKPVIDTDLTFERRQAEVEDIAESLK